MKKNTKLGLGIAAIAASAMLLSGCTGSFCSKEDKGHILFAIDAGVTNYYSDANALEGEPLEKVDGYEHLYRSSDISYSTNLQKIIKSAKDLSLQVPTVNYFKTLDEVILNVVVDAAFNDIDYVNNTLLKDVTGVEKLTTKEKITTTHLYGNEDFPGLFNEYGHLKYYVQTDVKETNKLWVAWDAHNETVRSLINVDECPTTDFISYYQTQMNNNIANFRSCLAIDTGYYGNYNGKEVKITAKNWGYAWGVDPLSGLLVFPIGALTDVITKGLLQGGVVAGVAQLLALIIITILVRGIMLVATFKQTTATSKMQNLQPEIAKIQAKYPNSNTNQYEKQRLAEETMKLYKKHKINPFGSIIMMFIQFPVFICVWGALQGSAYLSSDAVLGLNLSDSISSVLFTWSNWRDPSSGVWTALVLFLLMAGSQVVSMLLPQWIQKSKLKKLEKLGKNPAQKQQDNKMKWFTYIMMVMIIVMGFSLASAMGVYWLIGALISVAQTLITNAVNNRKTHKKKK